MKSTKIVILDGYMTNPGDLEWKEMEMLGEVTVYNRSSNQNFEKLVERAKDADVLVVNKIKVTKELLEQCKNLKMITTLSTGFNTIDLDAASERGIVVSNVPAYSTEAVAQFTFALLLDICLNVSAYNREVKNGQWTRSKDFCFYANPLIELKDKTYGIIGLGNIGKAVAKIAKAMGMKVIAYAPRRHNKGAELAEYVELNELYRRSDVISLHCPLNPLTRGMIDKTSIEKMKDGVILLNVSRGPVIVEEDVANALQSGKIYAAGVDVVSAEPIKEDNPLLKCENCIITPHIAWAAKDTRKRLISVATQNIRGFLNGKVQNRVNP